MNVDEINDLCGMMTDAFNAMQDGSYKHEDPRSITPGPVETFCSCVRRVCEAGLQVRISYEPYSGLAIAIIKPERAPLE